MFETGTKNKNGSKADTIQCINNSFVMNFNKDLAKSVFFLEKLMIYMHKQKIKDLALSCDDKIFELISIVFFKEFIMRCIKEYLNQINIEILN